MRNYDISQRRVPQGTGIEILPPVTALAHSGLVALRAMIPCLIAWLRIHAGERGSIGIARRVEASLRRLYAKEKAAMAEIIKIALRSCPEWRARVFEDLGGAAALARWEARLLRAYAPPPEEDYSWLDDDPEDWVLIDEQGPVKRTSPSKNNGPRLDRDGLFKWASIKQNKYHLRVPRRYDGPREEPIGEPDFGMFRQRTPRDLFAGPWPIEVRPSDLDDPVAPDEIIILTRKPLEYWSAYMADPMKWHGQMIEINQRLRPETNAACLLPD